MHDIECSLEFDVNDWIEFDYLNSKNDLDHWKIEVLKINYINEWLLFGIDLETGDEFTFMMKNMFHVKHY